MYGTPSSGALKKERRRDRRDAFSASLTALWGNSPNQEQLGRVNLVDISAHGAKFRVQTRIPPGAWLMFNDTKNQIGGRGTVRYCRLARGVYEVGVEFPNGTGWDSRAAKAKENPEPTCPALASTSATQSGA